jgi:hypothetical protein
MRDERDAVGRQLGIAGHESEQCGWRERDSSDTVGKAGWGDMHGLEEVWLVAGDLATQE